MLVGMLWEVCSCKSVESRWGGSGKSGSLVPEEVEEEEDWDEVVEEEES